MTHYQYTEKRAYYELKPECLKITDDRAYVVACRVHPVILFIYYYILTYFHNWLVLTSLLCPELLNQDSLP